MGLIDFHSHLSPSQEALKKLLRTMEDSGLSSSIVVAGGLMTPSCLSRQMFDNKESDVSVPNSAILELSKSTSGRLLPFYFANPHLSTDEYRIHGDFYFGLKLGPTVHGVSLTDERNTRYIDLANSLGHCVYLHCLYAKGKTVQALQLLAHSYPGVSFILGHAGVGNCDFQAVDEIQDFPNIYFETSGGFLSVIRYAQEKLGKNRILFGSEYPLQDPQLEILKMKIAGLSNEILNANVRALLGFEVGNG